MWPKSNWKWLFGQSAGECLIAGKASRSWLKRFKGQRLKLHVICEASGGYEKSLVAALQKRTLVVSLVQANRVRQFARAAGILAKTDQIDAAILVSFGMAMRPPPTAAQPEPIVRLRELDAQRRHLSRLLSAEQNRLAQLSCAELRSLSRSLISKVKKQISTLDARIATLIAQDQTLRLKAQKLTSIVGVGPRTAALLLAQMPEPRQPQSSSSCRSGWPGSI
jgi:transposase